jgi:hypothetical protein
MLWLDLFFFAPHPVCNTRNLRYADQLARLFSSERVLFQVVHDKYKSRWDGINGFIID